MPVFLRARARLLCLALLVLRIVPARCAALSFQVAADYTKAPECQAFAEKSKAVIEEWYPKINEILFGNGRALPADSITLVCEPMKYISYADIQKNRIHISAAFVKTHPEGYGTIVHELTHIVQHYAKLKRDGVWLQEGIADYIRHQYFEQDMDGPALAVDPDHDSYLKGYRVAAAFLGWLQKQKSPTVVQDLNRGCAEGNCTANLFLSVCGKDVDTLWAEFTSEIRSKKQGSQ